MVVNVVEVLVAILQFEVVPVLAADEKAGITVLQFEVVDALEDAGDHLVLLEVQSAIIGRGRR
ncbi:hypothetical protein D3C78_1641430 [compost metagenome]